MIMKKKIIIENREEVKKKLEAHPIKPDPYKECLLTLLIRSLRKKED